MAQGLGVRLLGTQIPSSTLLCMVQSHGGGFQEEATEASEAQACGGRGRGGVRNLVSPWLRHVLWGVRRGLGETQRGMEAQALKRQGAMSPGGGLGGPGARAATGRGVQSDPVPTMCSRSVVF